MTASKRGAALVALVVCSLQAGPAAWAEELLVMPYACRAIDGLPLLTPGPEQSHRILGRREQKRFTACSPANPGLCRHWTVYRFDLDCDGTLVPWVSVAAAAGEANRRARLVEGRLQLRMAPAWSLAPDDPCAREPGPDDRRMRRHCADRLAMAPPPVVEMPTGFAPLLGIDAIFVKAAPGLGKGPPRDVAAPPPPKAAGDRLPQQTQLDGIPGSPEKPEPVAKEPPPKEAPAREPAAKSPPAAPPKVAAQPPPKVDPVVPPAPAPDTAATPKGADRPEAKPVAPPPPPKAAAPDAKPAPKVAAAPPPKEEVAKTPPPPRKQEVARAPPPPPPPKTMAEPEGQPQSVNLFSVFRATTIGAIVAFAGLALGLLTAFALARRRERVREGGMRPRDIASVSLDGGRAKPPARLGYARGRVPPNAAASAMSRLPGVGVATGGLAGWGDRMPATKAEALEVLGIGVTPSASEAAIKKMVDGLRMSWHPDLAKDEPDRQLRELRSKQINAAWDLLQDERAQA